MCSPVGMSDNNVSRRDVLRSATGGAIALAGATGPAAADPETQDHGRHNIGLTKDAPKGLAKDKANSVHRQMDFGRIGRAVSGKFPDQALKGLKKNPHVRYVEKDHFEYHAFAQTLPWGIDRVDADKLHANGQTGNGADIAIIDTGIDQDHPDLQANLGTGEDFTGSGTWDDANGHGTHCAGIADAVDNSQAVVGVSTEATLHAVRVLGSGGSGSLSAIADGIRYVADQGWDVASMSLGASSGDQTLKDAVQYAANKGVLLVGAAGNDGPCSDCVGYPSAYSEVMAVSSTASDDSLSSFSSTGPEVEIAAPGSDILSTYNDGGTNTLSGTSMACPHVSGAGGQLMATGMSASEARTKLKSSAEDIGLGSNESGSGLLDAEAAVGGGPGFAVSTGTTSNVGETSATLQGSLDNLDGASSADVYFEWRESGASSWNTTSTQTLSATGSFSATISGLTKGTGYEYRAVGNASDGDSNTGSTATFTTDSNCVDATVWPSGSGQTGAEYITNVNMDGQVVKSSADEAYNDFTCPDVVTVDQGGSFTIEMEFTDGGYDGHYGNVHVDWDQNGDWSTATETQIMSNVNDDTVTYSATVNVPSDAATGGTLARVRLSYGQFYGPSATGEYGEVNDFTVYVKGSSSESPPAVDSLTATEVETSDGDAEFDADWSVSDADGNLSSADLTLTQDSDGSTEDSTSVSVGGSSDSGTTRLVASGDEGSGNSYTVDLTVSDGAGNTASGSASVSESETDTTCVDAGNWPSGSGYSGYEYLTGVDVDGQVTETSSNNAYYDFTCPDVVTVQQGGSFDVTIAFEDDGYDGHYGSIHVDWDGDGSFSSGDGTAIMQNVADDTVTYTATVDVPSDATKGSTLARVRLSYGQFYVPSATGEYGEVNDFTIVVE
jgi:subtilisin family serine protease